MGLCHPSNQAPCSAVELRVCEVGRPRLLWGWFEVVGGGSMEAWSSFLKCANENNTSTHSMSMNRMNLILDVAHSLATTKTHSTCISSSCSSPSIPQSSPWSGNGLDTMRGIWGICTERLVKDAKPGIFGPRNDLHKRPWKKHLKFVLEEPEK